jgi:hypothetical protein
MLGKYTIEIVKEIGPNRYRGTVTFANGRVEALPTCFTAEDALNDAIAYLKQEAGSGLRAHA